MNLSYRLLFLCLLYVYVTANGIVKTFMKDGKESVQTEFLEQNAKYKQFLECSYTHSFKSTKITGEDVEPEAVTTLHRHVFVLQCIQLEGSEEKFVVLYFNTLAVDRMTVKSCDKSEVESSIFPPKLQNIMEKYYGNVHEHVQEKFSPNFRFLKEEDDSCYERIFTVGLTKETEEFELIQRKSPTVEKTRNSKCGKVEFINCRAPTKELRDIITQNLEPDLGITAKWVPYHNEKDELGVHGDITGLTINEILQCWVMYPDTKTSDIFGELICVKVKETSGETFYAFVKQIDTDEYNMERFTVTSCSEDDVVNAIFPGRVNNPEAHKGHLRFKKNGKCYEQSYVKDQQDKKPDEIDCPSNDFDWVNPRKGSSAIWSDCVDPETSEIQGPLEDLNDKSKFPVK